MGDEDLKFFGENDVDLQLTLQTVLLPFCLKTVAPFLFKIPFLVGWLVKKT